MLDWSLLTNQSCFFYDDTNNSPPTNVEDLDLDYDIPEDNDVDGMLGDIMPDHGAGLSPATLDAVHCPTHKQHIFLIYNTEV